MFKFVGKKFNLCFQNDAKVPVYADAGFVYCSIHLLQVAVREDLYFRGD